LDFWIDFSTLVPGPFFDSRMKYTMQPSTIISLVAG